MPTGQVKWFSDEKGYGFIAPDDGTRDVFVHHRAIRSAGFRTLAEGAKVEYEVQAGGKGPQAVDVRPVGVPAVPEVARSAPHAAAAPDPAMPLRRAQEQLARLEYQAAQIEVELGQVNAEIRNLETALYYAGGHDARADRRLNARLMKLQGVRSRKWERNVSLAQRIQWAREELARYA